MQRLLRICTAVIDLALRTANAHHPQSVSSLAQASPSPEPLVMLCTCYARCGCLGVKCWSARAAGSMPEALAGKIQKARRALDLPAVEYEGTMDAKLKIARELFDLSGHRELQVRQSLGSWSCRVRSLACAWPAAAGTRVTHRTALLTPI